MNEQPRPTRIRLDLTRRQQEQIRQATGREVSTLDLGLEILGEPASLPPPAASDDSDKTG